MGEDSAPPTSAFRPVMTGSSSLRRTASGSLCAGREGLLAQPEAWPNLAAVVDHGAPPTMAPGGGFALAPTLVAPLLPATSCTSRAAMPAPGGLPPLASGVIPYRLTGGQAGHLPLRAVAKVVDTHLGDQLLGQAGALRDEQNRIVVDCHPARWAEIFEFLSTGAVPERPGPELLAQARAFGIAALVERLEARWTDVRVLSLGSLLGGPFAARFTFCNVIDAAGGVPQRAQEVLDGTRLWRMTVAPAALYLSVHLVSADEAAAASLPAALNLQLTLRVAGPPRRWQDDALAVHAGTLAIPWVKFEGTLQQLVSEQVALCRGGLVVELAVR